MNKNEPAIQAGQMDCMSSFASDKAGTSGLVDKAVQYCRLHIPGASSPVHLQATAVDAPLPVQPLRTDVWNFAHPSFYL